MVDDKFDSVFADQMDDDTEFDAIFGSQEDGDIVDMVCGFKESGECETDFDELHNQDYNADPDDFEDLVGDETKNTPKDAEGTDDDPAIDLALGEADFDAEFEEIHQTEDDAEPDDFEEEIAGEETDNAPDDAEGGDFSLEAAFGEEFDIIHQNADGACAKTLDDEVTGKETLNGAKNPEGTDDEPLIDLAAGTGHKNPKHDETRIEDEFDKLMEEVVDDMDDAEYDNDSEGELKGEDYEDSGLIDDDMDSVMDSLDDECNESDFFEVDSTTTYDDGVTEEDDVEEYVDDYSDYDAGDGDLVDLVAGK